MGEMRESFDIENPSKIDTTKLLAPQETSFYRRYCVGILLALAVIAVVLGVCLTTFLPKDSDSTTSTDDYQSDSFIYCNVSSTETCPISSMNQNSNNIVVPGGETRCIFSTSTPFAFQVIPGDSDKLLFYFQGGGACNDAASTFGGGCTTDAIPTDQIGVFSRTNDLNLFKDYTVVYVMYCSGDLYTGNVIRPYNDTAGVPVSQQGLANGHSALNWTIAQTLNGGLASTFSDVVVMGCSAGALGTQFWAKTIMTTLNYDHGAVVPDSYISANPPGASMGPTLYEWGFCRSGFLTPALLELCLAKTLEVWDVVLDAAEALPAVPFAYIQSKADRVQYSYFVLEGQQLGIPTSELTTVDFYQVANQIMTNYTQRANFVSYVIDGTQHCYTCYDSYFTADSTGVSGTPGSTPTLASWVGQMPLQNSQTSSIASVCNGTLQNPVSEINQCSSNLTPRSYTEV